MNKITPFLWFNDNAEEAMKFYLSIFKNSKKLSIKRKDGKVIATTFRLNGQEFMALNGGPSYKFTPAISFMVHCQTQAEIDYYWEKLSKEGREIQCGWLSDKYGLSWQIVPAALEDILWKASSKAKGRVWDALMKMTKLDIKALKAAAKTKQPSKKK